MEVFFTWEVTSARSRRHPFPDQEPPVQLCLDLSVSENGAVIRMVYVFMKAVVQDAGKAQQVRLDRPPFFPDPSPFPRPLCHGKKAPGPAPHGARSPYGRSGYHLMNGKRTGCPAQKAPGKSSPFPSGPPSGSPDPASCKPDVQTDHGQMLPAYGTPLSQIHLKGAAAKGRPRNHSFATAPFTSLFNYFHSARYS